MILIMALIYVQEGSMICAGFKWSKMHLYINPQNLITLFYTQKVKYIIIIIIYFCICMS
jgi:hypothetical protein